MDCIIFREGIYTAIEERDCSDEQALADSNMLVISDNKSYRNDLYGGRVYVEMYGDMKIDGISIRSIGFTNGYLYLGYPSIKGMTSYLNQIENLGVDTFLENYKKSVESAKIDCARIIEGYEQDLALSPNDSKIQGILRELRGVMQALVVLFFALSCYANIGLDNHVYTENYEAIINMYFS